MMKTMSEEGFENIIRQIVAEYDTLSFDEKLRAGPLSVEKLWNKAFEYKLASSSTPFFNGAQERQHALGSEALPTLKSSISAGGDNGDATSKSGAEGRSDRRDFSSIIMRNVPSLYRFALLEARIQSKIYSALATRPVVTVYELENEICLMEGIPQFSDLRLGVSLIEWPVIQAYFQCRQGNVVFPVTSRMFLQFIAHHPSADQIRAGVGDVRDAMHAFQFYYEKEVLPYICKKRVSDSQSKAFQRMSLPSRVSNTRALGIHVQNFHEIIAALRREASIHDKQASFRAVLSNSSKVAQQKANIPFYEKVITSLDHAIITQRFSSEPLIFSVHCSEEELSSFILPQSWKRMFEKENLPEGGYRIEFFTSDVQRSSCSLVCTSPCVPSFVNKRDSQAMEEAFSQQIHTKCSQESSPFVSSTSQTQTSLNPRRRRQKKGKIMSDENETLAESELLGWSGENLPSPLDSLQNFPHVSFSSIVVPPEDYQDVRQMGVVNDEQDSHSHEGRVELLKGENKSKLMEDTSQVKNDVSIQMLKKELEKGKEMKGMNVIQLLAKLQLGSTISFSLLTLAFETLSRLQNFPEEGNKLWDVPFIPLISTNPRCDEHEGDVPSVTDRLGSVNVLSIQIDEIAAPSTVCWSFSFSREDTDFSFLEEEDLALPQRCTDEANQEGNVLGVQHIQKYFRRNLDRYYPKHLKSFFVQKLGIFAFPSIATWISVSHWLSREAKLTEDLEGEYLKLFSLCVQEELNQRIDQYIMHSSHSTVNKGRESECTTDLQVVGEKALFDLIHSIPEGMYSKLGLFPLNKRWWRGAEGLFACGPRYFGYRGLYFQPAPDASLSLHNESVEADLLCLTFKEEIHFAVEAVLQRCGVQLVHEVSVPFISMEHPRGRAGYNDPSRVAASIHAVIEAMLPAIQFYFFHWHPLLYVLSEKEVRRRLGSVRVLLGYNVRITEQLEDPLTGHIFTMSQSPRLRYIPSHNAFYGPVELFSSPVLADVFCDFFLPLTPSTTARQEFFAFFRSLLSKTSDAHGERVVDSALHQLIEEERVRLQRILSCGKTFCDAETQLGRKAWKWQKGEKGEIAAFTPWEIVRPPSRVLRFNFPPGEDAMGSGTLSLALLRESKKVGSARHDEKTPAMEWKRESHLRGTTRLAKKAASYGTIPPEWAWDGITSFSEPHAVLQQHLSPFMDRCTIESHDSKTVATRDPVASCPVRPNITSVGLKRYRDDGENLIENDFFSIGQVKATTVGEEESRIRRYALEGEKFVWKQLKERFSSDSSIHVVWLNEEAEKGEPYDIVVFREDSNGQRRILYFVEVKSTSSGNRRDFELSLSEFLFAAKYGSAFHVHRVYNASTNELRRMRIDEYNNIISKWQKGQLTLTGDIHVVPPLNSHK